MKTQGFEEVLMSLRQFLKLPEFKPPLEFWGGRVIQKVAQDLIRSTIKGELLVAIQAHARPTKLGRAYLGLRCDFEGQSHVFHLCYFAEDRRPRTSTNGEGSVKIAPDLAVEIAATGQAMGELSRKLHSAIRGGVRQGWLIDPKKRRVWVFRTPGPADLLGIGDALDADEIIPGFSLPLATIFGWLDND